MIRLLLIVALLSGVSLLAPSWNFIIDDEDESWVVRQDKKSAKEMVWSDDFGDPEIDTSKWTFDLGDGCPDLCGWGNNEMQSYTDRNAFTDDGILIIEARKEKTETREYTSARLVSRFKGDWKYGRIEARIKLPSGTGTWPAFWMLPTDWVYGRWPGSGEIDVMEHVGYAPDSLFGTVHTKAFNGMIGTQVGNSIKQTGLEGVFRVYAIEWREKQIDFFMDDQLYFTFENDGTGSDSWPFDQRFHIVTNLAVGGNWGGKHGIDPEIWPQRMEIDYVRVYKLLK